MPKETTEAQIRQKLDELIDHVTDVIGRSELDCGQWDHETRELLAWDIITHLQGHYIPSVEDVEQ